MGQIAEDMLDGSCCQSCGQYFEHANGGIYCHEHPVVCWDCWEDELNKTELTRADVKTF